MMFRTKICGVTTAEDARFAIDAGADAIGLNFYSGSRRFLNAIAAREIADAVSQSALKIGVFVNAPASDVLQSMRQFNLDAVQIHGDEPPEMLSELSAVRIVRAFRCDGDISPIVGYVNRCAQLGVKLEALLIDAYSANEYGGAGRMGDWSAARRLRETITGIPLILAGGLTPANVAEAIDAARPDGVDTASGVETNGAHKDPQKCREFVLNARAALDRSQR